MRPLRGERLRWSRDSALPARLRQQVRWQRPSRLDPNREHTDAIRSVRPLLALKHAAVVRLSAASVIDRLPFHSAVVRWEQQVLLSN